MADVTAALTDRRSPVRLVLMNFERRGCPYVEAGDLEQEAALTLLAIERAGTWRRETGPLGPYQARAVGKRLFEMTRRSQNPLPNWAGVPFERAALAALECEPDGNAPDLDRRLDLARAAREIADIMDLQSDVARAILIEERKADEVAREFGISRDEVYLKTRAARRALKKSRALRRIAEELFAA